MTDVQTQYNDIMLTIKAAQQRLEKGHKVPKTELDEILDHLNKLQETLEFTLKRTPLMRNTIKKAMISVDKTIDLIQTDLNNPDEIVLKDGFYYKTGKVNG